MATVIFTSKPAAAISVVPNQNTTLTVTASTDVVNSYFTYQWRKTPLGGSIANIAGATSVSFVFEPTLADYGNASITCRVDAMSATSTTPASQANASYTSATVLTVSADATVFNRWTPRDLNPLNESGPERFRRMRNQGYC
jgi:hypothetical protein